MILNERESIPEFITEDFTPYSIKNDEVIHRTPGW